MTWIYNKLASSITFHLVDWISRDLQTVNTRKSFVLSKDWINTKIILTRIPHKHGQLKSFFLLLLLELGDAFDTVDVKKLIEILKYVFKVSRNYLKLFISYSKNRTQVVVVNKMNSKSFPFKYVVPQESRVCPIAFQFTYHFYELTKQFNATLWVW